MKFANEDRTIPLRRRLLPVLVVIVALLATSLVALAAAPLSVAGWLNHSYAGPPANDILEPTSKSPESKLWWHDGYWWGVLFSPAEAAFTIHRLNATTHDWVDTGVLVDDRIEDTPNRAARADVLWDGEKLYIATHLRRGNPSDNNVSTNWARLLVYTYNNAADSWTLESGYPVTINRDVTVALVLDKDSMGRLWITYVSATSTPASPYQVYVNASAPGDPKVWGTPSVLPFPQAVGLNMEDISALAAFTDASGPKVAVLWSNQTTGNFYLAVRPDSAGADPTAGWALEQGLTDLFPVGSGDDHMKLARAPGNLLVATVKTNLTGENQPLIAVVKRAPNGAYSLHPVALYGTQDTRPTMAVDAHNNQVHVFSVSKEGGGYVCIQSADLPDLNFGETYNCPPPPNAPPEILAPMMANVILSDVIIGDNTTYFWISDPTTAKHWLTEESGIAVLASDEMNKVYTHNVLGGTIPPPPPPPGDERLYLPLIVR